MADDIISRIAQMQSMEQAARGGMGPGSLFGMLPDADVSGGFQMMILGIGKNPLNTPLVSLINSGRIGAKPGKQALLARIAAQMSSDFSKANQQAAEFARMLAHDVQSGPITHGLPRDFGTGGGGHREV
ncbi:MAG: hypothetical protein ACOYJ2_05770 [Rickettsiales bacterium]